MRKFLILLIISTISLYSYSQCEGEVDYNADGVECDTKANSIKTAIARVDYGNFKGTGSVVNNTNNDGRYLFLTSSQIFHTNCLTTTPADGTHFSGITFYWEQELGSCTYPHHPVSPSTLHTSGATLLSTDGEFALFELDIKPPFAEVLALGWDFSGNDPSSPFSIMHVAALDTPGAIQVNIYKAALKPDGSLSSGGVDPACWTSSPSNIVVTGFGDYVVDKFVKGGPYQSDVVNGYPYSVGGPLLGGNKQIYGTYQTGFNAFCDWHDSYFEKFSNLSYGSNSIRDILTNGTNVTSHHGIEFTLCEDINVIDFPINSSSTYKTSIRIIASTEIVNNITVLYQAGEEIILSNGFSSGTDFIAEIEPCQFEYYDLVSKTDGEKEVYNENIRSFTKTKTPNKVYPTINKANGIVNIDFNDIELLKEIQLYNMQGQLILNKNNISSNNTEIVLPDNINKGMYILKVLGNNNQIENFKIIVE